MGAGEDKVIGALYDDGCGVEVGVTAMFAELADE